jgi:mannose-6-phosphate isomerase-like protein (cupin superfamily)
MRLPPTARPTIPEPKIIAWSAPPPTAPATWKSHWAISNATKAPPPHPHPDLEQAVYILEGEAIAGIDGVDHHVKAGDMMFFPARVFHSIRVLTERIKMLVIYAPPYGEDPAKVMHAPGGE